MSEPQDLACWPRWFDLSRCLTETTRSIFLSQELEIWNHEWVPQEPTPRPMAAGRGNPRSRPVLPLSHVWHKSSFNSVSASVSGPHLEPVTQFFKITKNYTALHPSFFPAWYHLSLPGKSGYTSAGVPSKALRDTKGAEWYVRKVCVCVHVYFSFPPRITEKSILGSIFFFLKAMGAVYGRNQSCSHQPLPQPQQCQIQAASTTYIAACSNAACLIH